MRCEDFPCCGHEAGCCPSYVNGRQTNMVCVCGAELPVDNRYSCCDSCLDRDEEMDREQWDDDAEADRDFLLEQQEMEDFEQADEYFNHYDYNDWE